MHSRRLSLLFSFSVNLWPKWCLTSRFALLFRQSLVGSFVVLLFRSNFRRLLLLSLGLLLLLSWLSLKREGNVRLASLLLLLLLLLTFFWLRLKALLSLRLLFLQLLLLLRLWWLFGLEPCQWVDAHAADLDRRHFLLLVTET